MNNSWSEDENREERPSVGGPNERKKYVKFSRNFKLLKNKELRY